MEKNKARGTEEQFLKIIHAIERNNKAYVEKQIKFYQWAETVDQIFTDYMWSKSEFYKEVNLRLGIQTNETREKKRSVPPKKKSLP